MTAPQIVERALRFNFAPSVSATTGLPEIMEVAVIPLSDASSAPAGATFAGGLRTATVELVSPGPNTAIFDLIPTYSPGLDVPITYRVMWRAGVMGRTYTSDFVMPDVDCTWEELRAGVGSVIDGQTYLQQSDLGVPGRVARLDDEGRVIDGAGNPVADSSSYQTIANSLVVESVQRAQGDNDLRRNLEAQMAQQDSSTLTTAQTYVDNQVILLTADLSGERGARTGGDAGLQAQITDLDAALQGEIDSLSGTLGDHAAALVLKANLDETGHIFLAEIPETVFTTAHPVADQAAMLALTYPTAHKGDMAVRPDGTWQLLTDDPSQLNNWIGVTVVNSVNGKRGAVTLTATDVGAIPTGGSIIQSQVTGLSTALGLKANQSDLTTVTGQVQSIVSDATLVHTTAGVVPSTLLDANMVYLNGSGQLVHKDGTIIPVGSGGTGAVFSVNSKTGLVVLTAADVGAIASNSTTIGQNQVTGLTAALQASIPQSQVTGLTTALGLKATKTDGLVPLSEIPTLPTSKTTGLSTLISGNQLSGNSNAINRVYSLESRVTDLEGGGGGEGGGATSTSVFFDAAELVNPVLDLTTVSLHSPWGVDSDGTLTGTIGTWYYQHTGVRLADVAFPLISSNGHLLLRKWDETGPSDPVYALASDVSTLSSTVSAKAAQADLTALSNTVATKADQSAFSALSSTVDDKASTVALNSLTVTVAAKASQSDLDASVQAVATKASQYDLTALTNTVNTKAAQTGLTSATNAIGVINAALPHKADLDGANHLLVAQLPAIPQASVTNLTTALAAKADLSSGVLATAQIPTTIPQSSITGLTTALSTKADLVNGVLATAQIPAIALQNLQVVANRAALLALTTAQMQPGDVAIVSGTSDKGTYILTATDPSVFGNWTILASASGAVSSINGQTGVVVLGWSDVGAMAANASLPISQVTGLQTVLDAKAATTAMTSALAAKSSLADVQDMFYLSSMVKRADYVSSAPIASLAGPALVDGVVMPNNAVVLCTAQYASVNNGLWISNTAGAWTQRPADYAIGSLLARDTIVVVGNTTGSGNGTANNNTIWQETDPNGFIGTNTSHWSKIGYTAPPFSPVAGDGIAVTGSTFSANVVGGGGLQASGSGLSLDTNLVARKYVTNLVVNATTMTVTHNLNSTTPQVSIFDAYSNALVLAGVTANTANTIQIEFATNTGSYRVVCIG